MSTAALATRLMPGTTVQIYDRTVGPGYPVFIIAEAGSNHNGELARALELIDTAADAGADAVKFQTFKADRLYPTSAGTSDYLGSETPIYDIIAAMEMPEDWLPSLRDRAHERQLAFVSSPFHEEAVELLDHFVDAFKIASYELTHEPLLKAVAQKRHPIILSTGASTLNETRTAVERLRNYGCAAPIVLQCTAAYPTPLEAANVRALTTLARELDVLTGLSDHTRDPTAAPMAATALGAVVIEKHFTLDNELPGPDHAFAVEPDELRRLVQAVRRTEAVLGSGRKDVDPVEHELRHFARRSIFATCAISEGEQFSRENVDILRHGELAAGLPPEMLERVLESTAAREIEAETSLQPGDLKPAG